MRGFLALFVYLNHESGQILCGVAQMTSRLVFHTSYSDSSAKSANRMKHRAEISTEYYCELCH